MSGRDRAGTSRALTRALRLGVLLTAPLIAAPYFRSCAAPVHGVYPQPCHPAGAACTPSPQARTEELLTEAQTTSVLVLQRWDQMERCLPAPAPAFAAFETATSPHNDCWIDSNLDGALEHYATCHCYWNLDIAPPAGQHVHRACRSCT